MLEVLTCLGTDACVACDRTPTVSSGGALNGQLCRSCFAEVPVGLTPLSRPPAGLSGGWYLGAYSGPVGAMVRAGKYAGNEAVLWALGRHMAWGCEIDDVDVVVAVPSSPWRRLVRGMNPADLLACPVASCLGLPLMHPLVRRRSAPQAALSRGRRAANARGAFAAVAPVKGRVLLVDDVLTSGATAQACAEELLGAGAEEVRLLVVAAAAERPIPVS
jgi:predicted amidophosphoribosyltransferase